LIVDPKNPKVVTDKFQELTKKIILELMMKEYRPEDPAWLNYKRLIAVHPFDDYNGRSLRLWYRKQTGRPLFMQNFYSDLYETDIDFKREVDIGNVEYDLIVQGMKRAEAIEPHFPKYYERPEFWHVAAQAETTSTGDARAMMELSKRTVLQTSQKQFGEVLETLRKEVRKEIPVRSYVSVKYVDAYRSGVLKKSTTAKVRLNASQIAVDAEEILESLGRKVVK
jgi:hypothetical protein